MAYQAAGHRERIVLEDNLPGFLVFPAGDVAYVLGRLGIKGAGAQAGGNGCSGTRPRFTAFVILKRRVQVYTLADADAFQANAYRLTEKALDLAERDADDEDHQEYTEHNIWPTVLHTTYPASRFVGIISPGLHEYQSKQTYILICLRAYLLAGLFACGLI